MANSVAGFMGAILAALLWGSFAVPVKLVDTGDGFIFQWVRFLPLFSSIHPHLLPVRGIFVLIAAADARIESLRLFNIIVL